ncbi:MAG: gliding motility lipoprotein GldH [Paludibacter sp.]|nr:gliding motility lipoprotein GldH [Paludibacter sp.]
MKNLQPVSIVFTLWIVVAFFASCGHKAKYFEFREISPEGWTINTVCNYDVVMDTMQTYNVVVDIRHAGNYPYQNLWLFAERMSPDSTVVRDTISCDLADYTGKWLGQGSGSVYLFSVPYHKGKVVVPGKYTYTIRHGMRDENLQGIYAIGLRVESQNGEK